MIELYYYKSPNARKVLMALEEMGLSYDVRWVDIAAGDQHQKAFRAISPAGKIPVIVDHEADRGPLAIFESGAILLYLAEKSDRLLPGGQERQTVLSWLFWQVAQQGPMLGQAAHFFSHAAANGVEVPYAVERYVGEARRCYEILERQLTGKAWISDAFSIADIALFPWTRVAKGQGIDISNYPNVKRWSDAIAARPSAKVKPAAELLHGQGAGQAYTDEKARAALFGGVSPTGQ